MSGREFARLLVCAFLFLFSHFPLATGAEPKYETFQNLAGDKEGLLSESGFRSVMGDLQRTFEALSQYMYATNRKNAKDSIFFWDSYDNPKPYDLEEIASLYAKITDRWGSEIIHADYPNILRETDPRFIGYLKALQDPYRKLGRHVSSLSGAYKKAAERIDATRAEGQSTADIEKYIDHGYLQDVTTRVKALRDRGERELIRKRLKHANPAIRFRIAWAVAELKADEFTSEMEALLADRDEYVRSEGVAFFTLLAKKGYEERIGKLLSDPSSVVREWAADYVGAVKAIGYKKKLEELLNDPNENVRKWAQKSLEKMK
jgi:hypothetical protein